MGAGGPPPYPAPGPPPFGGPPFGGPPFGGPPPKKKGLSTGCVVAMLVVFGLFAAVGAVVFFIAYKIGTNKDVQNVMGALGDGAKIIAEAQAAPGTNELRALGCEQAFAIDAAKMQKLVGSFVDAGAAPPPEVERIVMCQVGAFGSPPACDDAARAYVRGGHPTRKFMLTVSANKVQTCGGIYDATGKSLGASGPGPQL